MAYSHYGKSIRGKSTVSKSGYTQVKPTKIVLIIGMGYVWVMSTHAIGTHKLFLHIEVSPKLSDPPCCCLPATGLSKASTFNEFPKPPRMAPAQVGSASPRESTNAPTVTGPDVADFCSEALGWYVNGARVVPHPTRATETT